MQWGRYSWNDNQPSLSFSRQFAVDVRAEWRPGAGLEDALREALWEFGECPTLRALWESTPLRSAVHLGRH